MFNRQGPTDNARETISALRLDTFGIGDGCGNHTGLPPLIQGMDAKAFAAIQASHILQRTYPPPAAATAQRPAIMQRGPVQDEGGKLDPLDRAAMDSVEGRAPGANVESPVPLIYPETGAEAPSPCSRRYTC